MKFKKDDNQAICPNCKLLVPINREGKLVTHKGIERVQIAYKWVEKEVKTCKGSGTRAK